MLYDLNIPWSQTTSSAKKTSEAERITHEETEMKQLERTISFLSELGYHTLALNHTLTAPLPSTITNPIPLQSALPFKVPPKVTFLRRATLILSDPSQNHRLSSIASQYDILALRPTTEKAYLSACLSLDAHSLISLDLTVRYPFHFKPKQLMAAINRGVLIEICYSQAVGGDSSARRNFIGNLMAIVRSTKGRGLVLSSEAKNVLGIRAPADVVNLLSVWGLGRERGMEGVGVNPRAVVVNEGLKRSGWRGIVDVVDGGQSLVPKEAEKVATSANGKKAEGKNGKGKRPAEDGKEGTPPMSKRAAKKAKLAAKKGAREQATPAATPQTDAAKMPLPPESSESPSKSIK